MKIWRKYQSAGISSIFFISTFLSDSFMDQIVWSDVPDGSGAEILNLRLRYIHFFITFERLLILQSFCQEFPESVLF